MDSGSLPFEEPGHVRGLRALADQVRTDLVAAASVADPARLRRVVGVHAMVGELVRVQPLARRSCRVTQPQYFYDPEDPGIPLVREARLRGVETELVTSPVTVRTHPLLPSLFPRALLGPVFLRSMVVDERELLVEGPDSAEGERTSWWTDLPDLVGAVVELWRRTTPHCSPILPPGTPPPLTERQLDVARLVAVGEKDSAIARRLHLSPRTVEREVGAVLRELGARNRTEAVLAMRGRGVNGGRPPG